MFTKSQIGSVAFLVLAASEDVSGLPLLASRAAASSAIGDFGSCSVPQIEFGVGFDNRKETSFQPVDKTSFNHGSAQAIGIITQFICDTLTNSCGADATAKATCASAQTAAAAQPPKTGADADAFNAVFGITTNFAAVAPVSDQGVTQALDGATAAASATSAATSTAAATSATDSASAAAAPATASNSSATAAAASSNSSIGDFGSCSVPQIEFGVGFDNRKETSFQPVDKTSFNHGSAQAIGIITQFICDTLTNSCGADATAKATCASAQTAAAAQPPKTGADADAFNAVFGITTNFAAVAPVSDQGVTQALDGATAATSATSAANLAAVSSAAPCESTVTVTVSSAAAAAPTNAAATNTSSTAASSSNSAVGNFGSCSVPQIEFGVGFDNRKETSFQPVDKTSFNHGSAQAIGIITQFICDTLTNSCGADATAKATCATAQTAAAAAPPKTGADADAFNAAFGITTNFAAVAPVDDQGVTQAVSGATAVAGASASVATSVAVTSAASATVASAAPASTGASSSSAASGANLQTFTGNLGGVTPPSVTANGDGTFQVDGNASFNNEQNALVRSCDVQHNQCANAANASGNKGDLTVDACGTQQTQCNAAVAA